MHAACVRSLKVSIRTAVWQCSTFLAPVYNWSKLGCCCCRCCCCCCCVVFVVVVVVVVVVVGHSRTALGKIAAAIMSA